MELSANEDSSVANSEQNKVSQHFATDYEHSFARVLTVAGVMTMEELTEKYGIKVAFQLADYWVGTERTIDEYQEFCGVNFREQLISLQVGSLCRTFLKICK